MSSKGYRKLDLDLDLDSILQTAVRLGEIIIKYRRNLGVFVLDVFRQMING